MEFEIDQRFHNDRATSFFSEREERVATFINTHKHKRSAKKKKTKKKETKN